jgi:hypothetical protein
MADIVTTGAIKEVLDVLEKLNGVDHYVPAEVPDTPLTGRRSMVFPMAVFEKCSKVAENEVGKRKLLDPQDLLSLAAVNYEMLKADNHPFPAEVAVLRSLIASRGFQITVGGTLPKLGDSVKAIHTKREEILIVAPSAELAYDKDKVLSRIGASLKPVVDVLKATDNEDYTKMATLLPIFAAIEFQKTNHHYIDDDFYKESYKRHFKSAQLLTLESKWNKASIIYDSVHWLGPFNMESYKQNLVADKKGYVPRGIVLKASPAPAGTALCRTQLAIWKAISVYPGGQELVNIYAPHIEAMNSLAVDISKKRLSYHVYSSLFNLPNLLDDPKTTERMQSCAQLAAIAQAFIETIAKGTDLARARALKKHAEQNIALFKIASAVFKGTLRKVEREATVQSLVAVIRGEPSPKLAALPAPEPVVVEDNP